jgi:hypothetical protein
MLLFGLSHHGSGENLPLHQRLPQNLWIELWIDDGQEYLSVILQGLTAAMKF